jgi:hypothetical protein
LECDELNADLGQKNPSLLVFSKKYITSAEEDDYVLIQITFYTSHKRFNKLRYCNPYKAVFYLTMDSVQVLQLIHWRSRGKKD